MDRSISERIQGQIDEAEGDKDYVPKWGTERRRNITITMVNPNKRDARLTVLTFMRKVCKAGDMTDFFDNRASEHDMQHVERILGL